MVLNSDYLTNLGNYTSNRVACPPNSIKPCTICGYERPLDVYFLREKIERNVVAPIPTVRAYPCVKSLILVNVQQANEGHHSAIS